MRIRHIAPAVGLLCLTVAGCTTISRGDPSSVPTSEVGTTDQSSPSSAGNEDLPSHGAPSVEAPLEDASRFEQDPCSILTAAQAQELTLPVTGKQEDGALGLDCVWRNPDTRGRVTIGFLTSNRRGLSAAYAANERGEYPYFIELSPIEGYPAIASDIVDRRSRGICIVEVGVSDQLAFNVSLQLSQVNVGQQDPCDTAVRVAGMALQTMKGA
jgi:hypothetical protein